MIAELTLRTPFLITTVIEFNFSLVCMASSTKAYAIPFHKATEFFVYSIISSQSNSTFMPVLALIWTTGTLPPLTSKSSPALPN